MSSAKSSFALEAPAFASWPIGSQYIGCPTGIATSDSLHREGLAEAVAGSISMVSDNLYYVCNAV